MGFASKRLRPDGTWDRRSSDATSEPAFKAVVTREKVGTELAKLIKNLFDIRSSSTCKCKTLADEMDRWGASGCQLRRQDIVARLVSNRDMLTNALKVSSIPLVKVAGAITGFLPDFALSHGASRLLDLAIQNAQAEFRSRTAQQRVQAKTNSQVRVKPSRRPRHIGNSFRNNGGPVRFITLEQYASDIRLLLAKVPHDVDCVAGVARSGLYPATMVAMMLHKPMVIVSQTAGHVMEAGNGWRLGQFRHVTPSMKRVLVVDDTVMTGGSQRRIREVVQKHFETVIYATVYCNPLATLGKPDIHAVDLEWPHLLEWNVFNSVVSPSMAVDFDGILCHDCTADQDDDGEKYRDFLANAKPLYLARKEPIPLIVTARIEKYRSLTEDWLRQHDIRWKSLIMHPAGSLAERNRDDIAAFKARHFEQWAKSHKPSPGPVLFCESDPRQAARIHQISGRTTICPATAQVWGGK